MFYNLGLHPAATSSLHSMYVHFRAHAALSVCTQCDVLHLTSNSHSDTPLLSHRYCWQFAPLNSPTLELWTSWRPDFTSFLYTCSTSITTPQDVHTRLSMAIYGLSTIEFVLYVDKSSLLLSTTLASFQARRERGYTHISYQYIGILYICKTYCFLYDKLELQGHLFVESTIL